MGDYLQNIVLRSLSLADVVQPRVPQLFEQGLASAPLPETSAQTEVAQVIRDPISEVQRTQITQARPTASEIENTSRLETKNQDHHLPFAVRPVERSPIVQEDPTPARLTPTVTTPDPVSFAKLVSKQSAELGTPSEQRQAGSTWREPSLAMIDQNPRPISNTRLQPSVPKRSVPTLPQSLHVEPQPPPVKITIGRVDVRAIMPSGPTKSAASVRPKPALSLESYLKQREEGKR